MTPEEITKQKEKEEKRLRKNQQQIVYWANHREEISQRRNVRIQCSCGKHVSKRHLQEHMASKNHTENTESNNNPIL